MTPFQNELLLTQMKRHGSPLWLVGGPIRDLLLGVECKDWDFVSRDAERMARRMAKASGGTFIVLDDENRIYRVVLSDGHTLDFAELQGRTIEDDLKRRDFTINAMARRFPDGPIIDPFRGQLDLRKRLIRGCSERAFQDDPLRVVRAFRFSAQLQAKVDPRTRGWLKKYRSGLTHVSAERIREELIRLWKQPKSGPVMRLMDQCGVLAHLFPEIEACRRTAVRYYGKGGVLRHSFETIDNLEWIIQHDISDDVRAYLHALIGGYPRLAWLKWAAFLHDIGKPATAKMFKGRLRFFEHEHVGAELTRRIGKRFRLSRKETHLLALWVRHHMRTGSLAAAPRITDKALSRFFRDLGEEGVGMVLLSLGDHYTYLRHALWGKGTDPVEKMGKKLLTSYFQERAKILPERLINGHDLMKALRIKPGPQIGKLLDAVQDAQAEGKVQTKEEALRFAKQRIKK